MYRIALEISPGMLMYDIYWVFEKLRKNVQICHERSGLGYEEDIDHLICKYV